MKGKIFLGIIAFAILLLAGAMLLKYSSFTHSTTDGTTNTKAPFLVSISAEDFTKETNIVRQVEVKTGDIFTIALGSNPTTGFSWTKQAQIADVNILKQIGHEYIAPSVNDGNNTVTGMSGIEEWLFTAGKTGTTTATMNYSRPWEGGEKDVRTFVLTVVVN